MPQPLSRRVLAAIRRHRMMQPGQRVIVGVSGGADSVALLLLLEELREPLPTTLIVAHFNHRLRGEAAEADERFVAELARSRGLECLVWREDVAECARRAGTNLEEEARKLRYAFFREAMRDRRASLAATGHTADDQAETVLARLARGTGLRGLAAIHPVLGPIVRPLLHLRRAELRDYLLARRQPWREDVTNHDSQRLRSRLRNLLPVLQAHCGENLVTNLAQLAEQARADEALIGELVERRFRRMVSRREGVVSLAVEDLARPRAALADARRALASRLVRRAVEEAQGNVRRLTADHVDRVLRLAREGTSGDRLELPAGLVVERALGRVLFLARGQRKARSAGALVYCCPADPWRAGEVVVPLAETGKRLRLKLIDWPAAGSETYPEAGVLDADRLDPPLQVRNWLPGDAYRPSGRSRVRKLKRLLLERRIAGSDRLQWPVLTSAGQPVWASGLAVAADWAAGPHTRQALLVKEELSEAAASR